MLLIERPKTASDSRAAAKTVLADFARRAYRRPVKEDELDRLIKLFDVATKQGEKFERAIRLPMKAVLVSPHFLYRIEDDPKNPNDVRTLNDFEFATRLSYFLWSTMPDEELFRLAERGRAPQAGRARSAGQADAQGPEGPRWPRTSPVSGSNCATSRSSLPTGVTSATGTSGCAAMIGEAEAYFEHVVRDDRSVLEFLDSDYTFVNGRIGAHYGIDNIYGVDFRKISLPGNRRGGVITMASTLAVTSNPTRTSPVKRGKWILENILGTPPPPPARRGRSAADQRLKGTLRQQMEQHRENPQCSVCHAKLDPLGFGLENFDGIGAGGPRTTSRTSTRRACCRAARSSRDQLKCGRFSWERPTCSAAVLPKNSLPTHSVAG